MNSENSTETVIQNLDEINQRQEDRINTLETKAIQLANLYFVFQGVILSTVSSSASSLSCRHWWIPFSLSLLAALLNLFAFGSTMVAYLNCSEGFDQNMEDLASASRRLDRRNAEVEGSPAGGGREIRGTKPDRFRKARRRGAACLGVLLFVCFTGIVLFSCRAILCPSGDLN